MRYMYKVSRNQSTSSPDETSSMQSKRRDSHPKWHRETNDNKQLLDEVFVLLYIERNKKKTCLCFFTDGKKNKASELDMITLRNDAPRSYTTWLPVTLTWLPVTLTWLLNNLQLWRHRRGFRKLTVRFRPIRKEIVSSMYNNTSILSLYHVEQQHSFSWRNTCLLLTAKLTSRNVLFM